MGRKHRFDVDRVLAYLKRVGPLSTVILAAKFEYTQAAVLNNLNKLALEGIVEFTIDRYRRSKIWRVK